MIKKLKKIILIVGFSIILIILSILFCKSHICNYADVSGIAMGTYVNQTVYCNQPDIVCTEALNAIKGLEDRISWRIDNSDIGKINSAPANEFIPVSAETLKILETSLNVAKLSSSAFNPTILPLSKLWNFDNEDKKIPEETEIKNILPCLDSNKLLLNKKTVSVAKTDSNIMLDLGAIGKGTACDIAVGIYKGKNIRAGIISVGGSIGIYGHKENNKPWKVAIRNPFIKDNSSISFANLNINSGFISTSGSYEKNFTYNNKFYHHILSTDTGYPVETDLISVTVYHANGTISDILSTACFVLGPIKSKSLLDKFQALAIFVNKNKAIIASDKLKDMLELTDKTFYVVEWI